MTDKLVAVVSGGLDSIGFLLQHDLYEAYVLTFDYGQKAQREIICAEEICSNLPFVARFRIVDMSSVGSLWVGSQLTDKSVKVENNYTQSVVVPLRNQVMLSIAAGYAYSIGAEKIIYGAHKTDEAGYPDCTPQFTKIQEVASRVGHFMMPLEITSPAVEGLSKRDNLIMASESNYAKYLFDTWSCYQNNTLQCGICESCRNRKAAFQEANIKDMTKYETD